MTKHKLSIGTIPEKVDQLVPQTGESVKKCWTSVEGRKGSGREGLSEVREKEIIEVIQKKV